MLSTGQQASLLQDMLDNFNIKIDHDLAIMKDNQTLVSSTTSIMEGTNDFFKKIEPDLVFVQGDTTTAFTTALSAFYSQIKVAHIEAGLRSGNINSPFPEEANRILIGQIAYFNFAPTIMSYNNLLK